MWDTGFGVYRMMMYNFEFKKILKKNIQKNTFLFTLTKLIYLKS